ncbi:MAG: HAD family phosphatase [Frankiales bacterium]|nr:HAD family phosphatase [Frankiales bacterium]
MCFRLLPDQPWSPRVVATDLDGTIVRSDGTISDRTRVALRAAEDAGALVVIVTGRPPRWLSGIADEAGHRGLAICANGALVWDLHDQRVVASYPLAVEVASEIAAALRAELPDLGFAVESGAGFAHEAAYRPRWATDERTVVAQIDELLTQPVAKLLARHEGLSADELLARARRVVDDSVATLTHSSREGLLEISAAGVTKASTLTALCAEHGLTGDDAVAFGDMPNDLPMLAWARHAVAVANAHPEVLAAVDEVTGSNDADGVATVLERFFDQ